MTTRPIRRLLGFVPARDGSRRVPDKNARPFGGSTLIKRAVTAALSAPSLDHVAFSSDSARYIELAREAGLVVGYVRPAELATDTATTVECVLDYLTWAAARDEHFSHVVLLQPTSPFCTADLIESAISTWVRSGTRGLVTVRPVVDKSSKIIARHRTTGRLHSFAEALPDERLFDLCVLTGEIYITPVEMLRDEERMWSSDFALLSRTPPDVMDIDVPKDFEAADILIRSGYEL